MTTHDLILRNARLLASDTDATGDLAVTDGKIAAIGEITGDAGTEIDCTGLVLTPGGVDAHCHIEQMSGMGLMNADTFESATRSAALGGTTMVAARSR